MESVIRAIILCRNPCKKKRFLQLTESSCIVSSTPFFYFSGHGDYFNHFFFIYKFIIGIFWLILALAGSIGGPVSTVFPFLVFLSVIQGCGDLGYGKRQKQEPVYGNGKVCTRRGFFGRGKLQPLSQNDRLYLFFLWQ
ncbi:MAG: hypothetical protein GX364_08460 [Firmicutes bacterium]|jgi:hypothetical protein|nr:hypothetical protein [Bacillota bacterium]